MVHRYARNSFMTTLSSMRLPIDKVSLLRLLKRVVIAAFALLPRTVFLGNVIRLRAQYLPNDLVKRDEDDSKDVMGLSYMRMLKRVIRLEGWKGLLRGVVPLAIATVFAFLWCPASCRCGVARFASVPDTVVHYCLLVLFEVPLTILLVRSITTPEMLPFFEMCRSFRVLLSPTERRRPWLLYPFGLFVAIALQRAWDTFLVSVLIKLIYRYVPHVLIDFGITLQGITLLSLMLFHAALSASLEVIQVRLAVQRHEQPIALSEAQHDALPTADVTDNVEPPGVITTKVVRLRHDSEQLAYTGVFNCARCIIVEEGFETFYRAWWYTILVALFTFGIIRI